MSLYKRLHDVQAAPATGAPARPGARRAAPEDPPPPHRRAGADPLRQAAVRGRPAPSGQRPAPRRPGAGARPAVRGRQGPAHPGRLRRHPRLRPHRPPPPGRRDLRGHVQRARQRLRGAQRQAREVDGHVRRRDPPAPHHRQDRERDRPAHRRVQPALRRPPPRRLPRQRRHPPAGHRRALPHHPEVLQGEAPGRRPHPLRHAQRPRRPLPAGLRGRSPQHHRLRRHRHRQDDHAQRAVVVHPVRRAHRHGGGRQGAPAPPGPRAVARGPAAEHRGSGRDHHPRPGQELPAHAARPHRGRRVPFRRGPGHAPGHEHRPRRLADHRPLQQPP